MKMYRLFIALSVICIILGIINKPKKMRLKNKNIIKEENNLIKKLDRLFYKHTVLYDLKEKYISKLQLINFKSYNYNNELILKYLAFELTISILLFVILSRLITMWYAVITISFVFFYIIIFFGINYIESKINRIHSQFPIALQCFLDEYIIHKNIKSAINSSYCKMPAEIGGAFELLARELSGEKEYELSIKKFTNELSYVWGYSFGEILIMSCEGSGDITDDLLTLNSMVSEEITAEEEEKSSRYGNKMTFIIIYAAALIGIIINLFTNNLASHLYFYTSTGNTLVAVWLIVLISGITVISLKERGR